MENLLFYYKLIFDELKIIQFFLNSDKVILDCGNHSSTILGYKKEDIINEKITSFLEPQSCTAINDLLLSSIIDECNNQTINLDFRCKNGSIIKLECSILSVKNDAVNSNVIILYSLDKSAIQEYNKFKNNKTDYKKLVETAPLGIITVDRNGNIIELNQKLADILGSPSIEATKLINCLTYPPLIEAGLAEDFIKCFESGKTTQSTKEYTSRWGKKIFVKYYLAPVHFENGTVTIIQAIVEDVTSVKKDEEELHDYRNRLEDIIKQRTDELLEINSNLKHEIEIRKQAEKELLKASKIESLGIFAGGIAHDFNNLLTAILGNISLANQNLCESDINYKILKEAENASLQARVLTLQLLTFSKGGEPLKKTTSIHDLLIDTAYFVLSGSHVKCDFFLTPDLWNAVIDQGQISQVIHNLIINARQSMTKSGVITIHADNVIVTEKDNLPLSKGDYIKITIMDQGEGIPEANINKIFDPYFTTKENGSGLGLAVTYSIIKRHDGYINLESKLGHGTTFFIYLPASKNKIHIPDNSLINEDIRHDGRILVMDDEDMVLKVVDKILTHLGFQIDTAKDGNETIELYNTAKKSGKPYDLVIMDLTIPGGMGGKEAIKILTKHDPDIKAIVSSGYSNDPILANFKQYGFSGIAAKPFRFNELKNEINRVLSIKKF